MGKKLEVGRRASANQARAAAVSGHPAVVGAEPARDEEERERGRDAGSGACSPVSAERQGHGGEPERGDEDRASRRRVVHPLRQGRVHGEEERRAGGRGDGGRRGSLPRPPLEGAAEREDEERVRNMGEEVPGVLHGRAEREIGRRALPRGDPPRPRLAEPIAQEEDRADVVGARGRGFEQVPPAGRSGEGRVLDHGREVVELEGGAEGRAVGDEAGGGDAEPEERRARRGAHAGEGTPGRPAGGAPGGRPAARMLASPPLRHLRPRPSAA